MVDGGNRRSAQITSDGFGFSTPIEPNSAPTSLIAVGRELEDGGRVQVRSGFSFSAAADWADTEPYHDGTSRSFVLFGSFVVDFVSLQENRSPIADLNHEGHDDHEEGCRSPACRSVSHASAPFESALRKLVGFAFATPQGFLGFRRRETGFPLRGDSIMGIVNGDRLASLRGGMRSSRVALHSVR
jgi:hypothetical protein